jgi:hypothetical protein
MKSVGYILWGLALASLITTAFEFSVIWIAASLLGLSLSYSLLHTCLYRPPEDHLGVIYQLGRLWRLVEPDRWIFVLPGVHTVKAPISLHVRRVPMTLSDLLTQDQVPIDCELIAFYQLDLRLADANFQSQALHIPEDGWNSVIKTVLQETANEVVGGIPFQQLLTPVGRNRLKRTLSALLAERVGRLGLMVSRQTGVSIQMLKPADAIWRAMRDRWAAVSLGEAALARVLPMLQELSQRHPEIGWEALLLEWAAVMAKEGTVPQVLVAPDQGPAVAALAGTDRQQAEGQPEANATALGPNGKREVNLARLGARMRRVKSP